MKTSFHHLWAVGLLGVLIQPTLPAQTLTLLEGFESGAESIAVFTDYGGRSAEGLVTIETYTAAGPGDPRVTEGTNSIAVTIGAPGWGNDLKITLPEEPSAAIQSAVAASANGTNVARYLLRYDVILPDSGQYVYFNHHAFLGKSRDYAVGAAADSAGRVTVSTSLDRGDLGLPTAGPVSWVIGNSFATVSPFSEPVTIYLDNIRLLDTYGPGVVTPLIYGLQSFEDGAVPLGGAATFTGWDGGNPVVRTTLSRYHAAFPEEVPVTDGDYALQVDNRGAGCCSEKGRRETAFSR